MTDERSTINVLAFAGSLRRGSYNRMLVRAARENVPDGMAITEYDLAGIPLYNGDVEAEGFPAPVRAFHEAIGNADALLIATPEYQEGVPGVLKNAIDWASRPMGKATILGKPVAIMGATPSLWGTARAQTQLRQALVYNNCPMVMKPQVFVASASERFDENGRLVHRATGRFIRQLLDSLLDLTRRHATADAG